MDGAPGGNGNETASPAQSPPRIIPYDDYDDEDDDPIVISI
jgi:hypothetical protein